MALPSKLLRHGSIAITVDAYEHMSDEVARAASDPMAAALDHACVHREAAADVRPH